MTRTEVMRTINTWLQAEKNKTFGRDRLTATQDRQLRVDVYHRITEYYSRRMSKADFGRFRKAMGRILFDEDESKWVTKHDNWKQEYKQRNDYNTE
jgi:hypothetical protein